MLLIWYLIVVAWFARANAANNSDVLQAISVQYGRTLYACLEELRLGLDVLTDFLYYWQPDHQITNRQSGCAAVCINQKLNLIDNAGLLSKPNADAFVKAAGGAETIPHLLVTILDDNLASYLIYLYQSCQTVATAAEECDKTLEVTNCFRNAVQRAQSSLDVKVVVQGTSDG